MHADLNFKTCENYLYIEGEKNAHFLLDCLRHMTLRQQLVFSLLDIPEQISLNLLIFGSVNLNDKENKVVFKSVVNHSMLLQLRAENIQNKD
jgi:hypothetical protein